MKSLVPVAPSAMFKYDAMCRMVAEVHKVDELKDIRDKVLAIEEYARQANNYDLEKQAFEIRKRAERRVGQLLKDKEKNQGGRPRGKLLPHGKGLNKQQNQTLSELGITYKQSHNWQKLASYQDEVFEEALRESLSGDKIVALKVAKKDEFEEPPKKLMTGRKHTDAKYELRLVWKEVADMMDVNPPALLEALGPRLTGNLRKQIVGLRAWLDRLEEYLDGQK